LALLPIAGIALVALPLSAFWLMEGIATIVP
jgi:hypothetical protein